MTPVPAIPPPWQQRAYLQAATVLDSGRMGHALLICGPALLGKRALAERLAHRLLCTRRQDDGEPCGQCRGCRLLAARAQTDPVELRPDGSLAHPHGHATHPDLFLVGYGINHKVRPPRARTEIVIEQIRALSDKLVLTPQYGGAQIGIIEPADAINHAACNALLKTLEEPQPGRHLWLVTANPARLPATIRSRCQRLEVRLPPYDEALEWLISEVHDRGKAEEALAAARGHPGLAAAWLRNGGLDVKRQVAADLDRLARGDASAAATAQRWVSDDQARLRLRFAAEQTLQEAGTVGEAGGLTDPLRTRRLAAWFDAANRVRALLRTTVRADLAVAELLLAWQRDANGRREGEAG